MGIYNLKLYDYAVGYQLRLYSRGTMYSEKIPSIKSALPDSLDPGEFSPDPRRVRTSELSVRTNEQIENSISASRGRTVSRIYEISRANTWDYFLTLTFDRRKLDSSDYDLLCTKVSKWLNNIRSSYAPDLKYLIVPELHKDGVHYHFHGLFSNIGSMTLLDSGVVKNGHTIYNLKNWKYGFSTVSKVLDSARVSSYITKYITKDLCAVARNKRRYWSSKNCDRARVRIYNIDYEDIDSFLDKNMHLLQHVSSSQLFKTGQKVTYIEMKREDGIPESESIASQLNSIMETTEIKQKAAISSSRLKDARALRQRLEDESFIELTDIESLVFCTDCFAPFSPP